MKVHIAASSRMLELALRMEPRELESLSPDDVESILVGEVYRRFPLYAPGVDGSTDVTFTAIRKRRYELLIDGPSMTSLLKGIYTESYETMTFRESLFMGLLKKKEVCA